MKAISSIAAIFGIGDSQFARQSVRTANPGRRVKMVSNSSATIRIALIVAGLAAGLGVGTAYAATGDASMPQPHSDSVGAAVSDTATTARVKAKLMGKDSLKKSDISVTTNNGVVTLDGSASNLHAKAVAEVAAKSVAGVQSVVDNLTTPASGEASAKTHSAVAKTERVVSDSWITTKVKSEILADSVSKGFDVSVETNHGTVVLKGALANQDAVDHVKDIAEKVEGVKNVNTSALVVAAR